MCPGVFPALIGVPIIPSAWNGGMGIWWLIVRSVIVNRLAVSRIVGDSRAVLPVRYLYVFKGSSCLSLRYCRRLPAKKLLVATLLVANHDVETYTPV